MRRTQASFSLNIRADEETEKLRRRLQRRLKCTAAEIVKRGLHALEESLDRNRREAPEATGVV
jgi:hypothetical protein